MINNAATYWHHRAINNPFQCLVFDTVTESTVYLQPDGESLLANIHLSEHNARLSVWVSKASLKVDLLFHNTVKYSIAEFFARLCMQILRVFIFAQTYLLTSRDPISNLAFEIGTAVGNPRPQDCFR